jgi:hypothetical protein
MSKKKPMFPFSIITAWIHPDHAGEQCVYCKQRVATHRWDNYVDQTRLVGSTLFANLTNDPWRRAIKAQANDVYTSTEASDSYCDQCFPKMAARYISDPEAEQRIMQGLPLHSFVFVLRVNSYEDEGKTYLFAISDDAQTIEEVADLVENIPIPEHPTTSYDAHKITREMADMAQRWGVPVKITSTEQEA